jgi:hypothetical protein
MEAPIGHQFSPYAVSHSPTPCPPPLPPSPPHQFSQRLRGLSHPRLHHGSTLGEWYKGVGEQRNDLGGFVARGTPKLVASRERPLTRPGEACGGPVASEEDVQTTTELADCTTHLSPPHINPPPPLSPCADLPPLFPPRTNRTTAVPSSPSPPPSSPSSPATPVNRPATRSRPAPLAASSSSPPTRPSPCKASWATPSTSLSA